MFELAPDTRSYPALVALTHRRASSFFLARCLAKVRKLDLAGVIGEQPLVMTMAKTIDTGEYLWKFEIWHAKGVADDSPLFG